MEFLLSFFARERSIVLKEVPFFELGQKSNAMNLADLTSRKMHFEFHLTKSVN